MRARPSLRRYVDGHETYKAENEDAEGAESMKHKADAELLHVPNTVDGIPQKIPAGKRQGFNFALVTAAYPALWSGKMSLKPDPLVTHAIEVGLIPTVSERHRGQKIKSPSPIECPDSQPRFVLYPHAMA